MVNHSEVGGGRNDEFKAPQVYKELFAEAEVAKDFPTQLEKSDIRAHEIQTGETEIVLQRHGQYVRDREDPQVGSLSAESAEAERQAAERYFQDFFESVPEGERDKVDILFVASDTQYFGKGKRSHETAELAQAAAEEVLGRLGLSKEQILKGEDGPRAARHFREPQFLDKSPDFVDYMLQKYGGINIEFWTAFESDVEKETRLKMGAEGPDDIADRTAFMVRVLARYAQVYHKRNPDRRLVIWGATHYDTISPFVKREVFGVEKKRQLLVDFGAGFTIDINREGNATTELGGKTYAVPVKRPAH